MDLVKKEWKTIVVTLCLLGMILFLLQINSQLKALKAQNAKLISTIDSIESVSISTDSGVHDMGKKIEGIDANVSFVVHKLRRR